MISHWKRILVAFAILGTLIMMVLAWSGIDRASKAFIPLKDITSIILHETGEGDQTLTPSASQVEQLLALVNDGVENWHPNRVRQANPDLSMETDQGRMEIHLPRRKCLTESWILSSQGSAKLSEAGCKSLRLFLEELAG